MIRPRHLLVAATLLGLGACAALRPDTYSELDASYRLDRGLAGLEAGRYREGFDDLAWVYAHCRDRTRGMQALVALSALELDPRNQAARPAVGTDLLGRLLREDPAPGYVRPLAESAYLMALSLGAPPAPAAMAEPAVPPDTAQAAAAALETTGAPEARVAVAGNATGATDSVRLVRAAQVLAPTSAEEVYGCGSPIEVGAPAPLPALPGPTMVSLLAAAERAREASVADADSLRVALDSARQRLQETEAELERIRQTLKP